MARSMPWFRVYTDFLFDSKIIELDFQDQRHFICLLALKSKGILDQSFSSLEKLDSLVASLLRVEQKIIGGIKKRLISVGLIDENWQPLAWAKRQRRSDQDPTNAERQRRYRERQKALKKEKEINAQKDFTTTSQATFEFFDLDTEESSSVEATKDTASEQSLKIIKQSPSTQSHTSHENSNYPTSAQQAKDSTREVSTTNAHEKKDTKEICKRIIDYINKTTGSQFRYAKSHFRLIKARLNDGVTERQIQEVIDLKNAEWGNNPSMSKYLRPQTLFRQSNFENYLGQVRFKGRLHINPVMPTYSGREKFNPREYINRGKIRNLKGDEHGYVIEAEQYREQPMVAAL